MKIWLFISVLFISWSSPGVSRIGGGKVASLISQFEMEAPAPFLNLKQYSNLVRAEGPPVFNAKGFASQFIDIREFQEYFPELVIAERSPIEKYFSDREWTKAAGQNNCVDAYAYTNETAMGLALTWGKGQGVLMQGPLTASVKEAIEKMAATIRIAPGACAWK